ncbi:hypothetical protein BpHYR1_002020 [Brachionus plicatilis]|uniref:Uncharacterized protein n=1 Tax=Brachionus plicatilis TaxID=10195 RepID=A0A3M7QAU2_BRAPC|nr:hypothetical protein BpHYR1_002020 [Brachionus plicatilis]
MSLFGQQGGDMIIYWMKHALVIFYALDVDLIGFDLSHMCNGSFGHILFSLIGMIPLPYLPWTI